MTNAADAPAIVPSKCLRDGVNVAGNDRTSWWTTLPGLLTALAGAITAVTGLVLGLNQIGLFGTDSPPPAVARDDAASGRGPSTADPSGTGSADQSAYEVTLPLEEEIRSGDEEYEILGYQARPDADSTLALSLSVRMTNHGPYPANFWNESFRLVLGEDVFAPSGDLNELVEGDASKVGTVLFVIPDTTRAADLKIKFDEGDRTIPFELRPV